MADSDIIRGLDNLEDAVSGETPGYEYKNPNTDMMKAISKCIDAADGTIGSEYHYDNPNTDVIQKMDELADAIATHSGGGGISTFKLYKGKIKNDTGIVSEDNDYYYTDFFPCSTDLTFDIGITGQPDYEGLTIYGEDKTYTTWYNPLSRYRNVQPSSSAKWCRLSFQASKSEYPLVHDWVNHIVYTTETPAKFSE